MPESLRQHERFWTITFGQGNAREFESWVPGGTESRKALSKCVRELGIKTILDVGCGLALDYEQYVEDGLDLEYHGVDLTEAFVDEVKRKHPGLDVRVGSAEALPYREHAFDAVSCRHLLEHLASPEKALAEMTRVSNRYVIVTWFIVPTTAPTEFARHERGPGCALYKNHYSLGYLIGLMRRYSLAWESVRSIGQEQLWVWEKAP